MKIDPQDLEFLKDLKYSNSYIFKPKLENKDFEYISKIDFLSETVKEKRVIHIGCVDHNIETIEKKIKKNKWLHKHLVDKCSYVLGVDIKKEEIEFIKKKFGYDVESFDITCKNSLIEKNSFDYLLLPDVIEHIGDPVSFLQKIRKNHLKSIERIIITVPNAFYKENFKNSKKDFEEINSDHRFWFTPYTITKILVDAGFDMENIYLYSKISSVKNRSVKKRLFSVNFLRKYIFNDSPFSRAGIIAIAKF